MKFRTFTVTLTLNTAIQFYTTLQLMMMYHPIKVSCKKIGRSVNMVETVISDYMSSYCDPDIEDSKPIFLHDTVACNDESHRFQYIAPTPQGWGGVGGGGRGCWVNVPQRERQ